MNQYLRHLDYHSKTYLECKNRGRWTTNIAHQYFPEPVFHSWFAGGVHQGV